MTVISNFVVSDWSGIATLQMNDGQADPLGDSSGEPTAVAHGRVGFHADEHAGLLAQHLPNLLDGLRLLGKHLGFVTTEERLVIGRRPQRLAQYGHNAEFRKMLVLDVEVSAEPVQ